MPAGVGWKNKNTWGRIAAEFLRNYLYATNWKIGCYGRQLRRIKNNPGNLWWNFQGRIFVFPRPVPRASDVSLGTASSQRPFFFEPTRSSPESVQSAPWPPSPSRPPAGREGRGEEGRLVGEFPLPSPLPARASRGEGDGRATQSDGCCTIFRND